MKGNTKTDIKQQLLTEPMRPLMIRQSLPAVIGMMVIGLYPLMDGIFAGNLIGETAMTACGVALPLTFMNSGISTLLGMGSASILSRALGKGDRAKVDRIMGNLIIWVILFSILTTVSGLLLAGHFLDLVGASGEIKNLGIRYLRVIFIGSLFVNFTQAANMQMRGEGLMKRAMAIMALGAFLNIVLDPILMTLMGDFAIEGAALATVTAQLIQAIVTLIYFTRKSKTVRIGRLKLDRTISREMFAVGASAMIMQLLFMLQQTLLYRQAFAYGGDPAGKIMAATLRIYAFAFIPLWGMSQGLQPVVGTNYGAGNFARVRQAVKVFMAGALILSAIFWIPAQVFPRQILSAFNISPALFDTGAAQFRLFYSVYILYGFMVMTITYFQAIGAAGKAGLLVLLRQLVLFVPAMLLLPKICGPLAVWWAEPAVDALMIIAGLLMLRRSLCQLGHTTTATSPAQHS